MEDESILGSLSDRALHVRHNADPIDFWMCLERILAGCIQSIQSRIQPSLHSTSYIYSVDHGPPPGAHYLIGNCLHTRVLVSNYTCGLYGLDNKKWVVSIYFLKDRFTGLIKTCDFYAAFS